MPFWDILKGIIPEKLINIDNRKVIINNSSITMGDEIINDHVLVTHLIDKLSEYQDSETIPFEVIHKDLDRGYEEYEEINQSDEVKKLKSILPKEEIQCILLARRVKLAYEKKNVPLAKELYNSLMQNYPEKGNKVYNLISGGYFDEMVIPFIDIFKIQFDSDYIQKYKEFYSDIIRFFPIAFFVGNNTTKEQIIESINYRLKLTVPFIRLHAIGKQNIKKIEEVIEELKIGDNYSIQNNHFVSPTGTKAQILEIKIAGQKTSLSLSNERYLNY